MTTLLADGVLEGSHRRSEPYPAILMLNASRFSVQQVILHCFTSDYSFSSPTALSVLLQFREIFAGDVTTLPLPAQSPVEIPRIILKSAAGDKQLQAGPERLSVIHSRQQAEDLNIADALRLAARVVFESRQVLKFRVSRLAVIMTRTLPIADPAMELVRHFCKEAMIDRTTDPKGALSRTENFELHAHKKFRPEGMDIDLNSWMRCKSGMLQSAQGATAAVAIEQDINTLAEAAPTANFDDNQVSQIFEKLVTELHAVMVLYFPEENA